MTSNTQEYTTRKPGTRVYQKPTLVKGPVLTKITATQAPISGGQPPCWVARAAFGVDDIRWIIFRAWLLDDAPSWFRSLYLRRGDAVGRWVAKHGRVRGVVRAMMMPAIRRKSRI